MNYRIIFQILAKIVRIVGLLMLIPTGLAFYYGDACFWPFLWVSLGMIGVGTAVVLSLRKAEVKLYAREGFLTVTLAWVAISLCGALPFWLSGEIPSFVDAFFETVSGFTTTGSTILTDIESMSKSLLFWRSFTHWIGGMGVLVFAMAIVPLAGNRAMYLLRAEAPGPDVGKLVPKARSNALILYGIYVLLTVLEVIFLLCGGLSLYDSFITTFGTVGTGGYSNLTASIAGYSSPYVEGVVTVFMLLCGMNFNIFFLFILRRFTQALKSEELHWYLGIIAVATAVITVNILPIYSKFSTAFRYAVFQVVSVNTSTGYATADFNLWPSLSRTILMVMMIIGCCAGSTGGGVKTVRVLLAGKGIVREVRRLLHTHSVRVLRFEGKPVSEELIGGVNIYLVMYAALAAFSTILISIDGFDLTTNLTASIAAISNIGPGLGMVGPAGSFAAFSHFSKIVLSVDMLAGRLEIFPLILTLSPSTWKR